MAFPSPEPGSRTVTLDDVYAMYREFLGRDPNYATEALPRVGNDYLATHAQIRCSQEAHNWRTAHGAEYDQWCSNRDPVTGRVITPNLPPPPPTPPVVTPPKPPGSDLPIIGGIIDALWPPIQEILKKINQIAANLGDNIGKTLKPVLEEIVKSGGRITQELSDNLTQLLPAALNLAGEAADKAAEVAKGFIENAATVGDIFDAAAEKLSLEKDSLWKFITDALGAGFGGGIQALLADIEDQHTENLNPILQAIQETDTIPGWVKGALGLKAGVTNPLALIVGVSLLMSVAGQFAQALLGPEIANTTYKSNESRTVLLVNAQQAAQAVAQQLRDYPPMQNIAQRNGFNADQFRLLADLAFQFAPYTQIIAARQRGFIDTDTEDRLLNRHGYDAENRKVLKDFAIGTASAQDEVLFMHRDVYEPEVVNQFKLMTDFPEGFAQSMARLGYPREVAERYYMSSWEIPSPNQLFEMLHRRIITEADVKAGLKAADILPIFRDAFIKIAYNPLTRVDIRRVHDLLKKDHAWLIERHKDIGYDADTAELLAQFVEALNDDERANRRKELTGPLVGRIISNVVNGTLSDEQASTFFTKLGYRPEAVDSFLVEARLIRNEQRTERIGNLLGDLYVKGRRTKLEATTQLRERGFTDTEIEERFRGWELEKELRAPTEKEEKERDLTRSDIEAMYRARQLERPLATQMLIQLRYSADEVRAILDLDDFKEKQSEDKDRTEVVHRKFVKGTFSRVDAQQALGTIGLRATQIEASLARWELEISAKSADLSVGQIGEVYKLHHWDDAETRTYLTRIGYDETEISALLRLWGSKIEEARKREDAAAARAEEARQREARRVLAEAARKEKDLAKTDLLNAGAAGVLRWDEVKLALIQKGYTSYEADVLIKTKQNQGVKKNA